MRPFVKHLRHRIHLVLHPRHKVAFISSIVRSGALLDVGCGNNSPAITKDLRPDIRYTGLDVYDDGQASSAIHPPDRCIIVPSERFAQRIESDPDCYDAVICAHNLEHCAEPERVLVAILQALKSGGILYLAFPCAESTQFPSRTGTLNFYDDPTHIHVPDFQGILNTLRQHTCEVTYARRRYRPWRLFLIGFILEPISTRKNKVIRGTWEFYGFESLIWARKK